MERRISTYRLRLGCALASLSAVGIAGTLIGYPQHYAPLPDAVITPTFLAVRATGQGRGFDWLWQYAVPALVGPVLLLTWHPGLARGAEGYPRRSFIGLLALTVLTAWWFRVGWALGVKYEDVLYVRGVCGVNVAMLTACWATAARAARGGSAGSTLLAHWAVVLWLVWVAFPWLGELL